MSFSSEGASTDKMEYIYSDLLLPMMDLDDQNNFDYTSFLQDEPNFNVGEGSSTSACSQPLAITSRQSLSPPSSGPGVGSSSRQAKLKHERRGHTKSRNGCFNCKKRRIKCQETRPACGHCVKSGLNCEYPVAPQITHQPQHQIPLFSLQDMRFFQHFLMNCYPHHPIGAESLWTHEIPCLSEKYEYLMHALLGLAASDLSKSTPSSTLQTAAMTHRLKAIRAIKHTLSSVTRSNAGSTWEEGNALMATCFALTFQSVLLDDGMVEYMTFIRGVVIVGIQMYIKGARLLFGEFLGDGQVELLRPVMEKVPLVDGEWVRGAVEAVDGLEGLCRGEVERGYWERLRDMAAGFCNTRTTLLVGLACLRSQSMGSGADPGAVSGARVT
ncbi:hypothetical protein DL546_008379 [Coniochaeta pulveracea]|uniref:Zn(2)-C6 fungal-type domain-containing protein n=1 Tax=Coniochaeta pulveracea TaxID=177199 RepID=A0A420YHS6_9PEZI|nr:hypothetical protein DL546_008379 [Coniochaeta pulveracea]